MNDNHDRPMMIAGTVLDLGTALQEALARTPVGSAAEQRIEEACALLTQLRDLLADRHAA